MKTTKLTRYSFSALLTLALLFFAGCSDDPFSSGDALTRTVENGSKMRHAHLLRTGDQAGKVLDRYGELSSANDFVLFIAADTQTDLFANFAVLDASSSELKQAMDRYGSEEGVTLKRSFNYVYQAFSIHVEDAHVERILLIIEDDDAIVSIEPEPTFAEGPDGKLLQVGGTQYLPPTLAQIKAHLSSTQSGNGYGEVEVELYILDTGVNHPDLNVVERFDFSVPGAMIQPNKVLDRYGTGTGSDIVGHGTHVAGIAAADDDANGIVGVAPGASIHDFKVLDDHGTGDMSGVIAAFDVIIARKLYEPDVPVVVNMSLGGDVGTTEYNAMDEAIVRAIEAGVVVVVAAGNDNIDAATVTPAHVEEAITVGAAYFSVANTAFSLSASAGNVWKKADFSNHGSLIDLFAPGIDVRSLSPMYPNLVVEMSGTSMAAPHVAGSAALFVSVYPLATPAQVRDALRTSAWQVVQNVPAGTDKHALNARNF